MPEPLNIPYENSWEENQKPFSKHHKKDQAQQETYMQVEVKQQVVQEQPKDLEVQWVLYLQILNLH